MSVDALKEFGKKCIEDEEMKKKVKEMSMKNITAIISFAKENGYDISKEDFKKLGDEVQGSGELSEDQLEQVAGGIVTSTAAVVVGGNPWDSGVVGVPAGAASAAATSSGGW